MPFFGGGAGDYLIVGTNIKGSTSAAPATVGTNNMALGNASLQGLTVGSNNIAIGNSASSTLLNGSNNTFIGYNSGKNLVTNTSNTISIGYNSFFNAGGTASVVIGNVACGFGTITNVSSSVVLGYSAQYNDNSIAHSVVIGSGAFLGGLVPGATITQAVAVGDNASAQNQGVAQRSRGGGG